MDALRRLALKPLRQRSSNPSGSGRNGSCAAATKIRNASNIREKLKCDCPDVNPRRAARKRQLGMEAKAQRTLDHVSCEQVRYRERSTVERVNGRLKDDFGGRQVRVRGHAKVLCHLMFGILALTVTQLLRLLN